MISIENRVYKVILCLLPFIYSFYYAPYGFGDHDTGFILGLSWQILSGGIPYSDIIYVRPPVSLFFHSIPLLFETNIGVLLDRCLFFFQIAIYSFLSTKLLSIRFEQIKPNYIYFLSCISFMLSVHTFPPMGWHTVDGIFFSVLGIYIIVYYDRSLIVIAGTLLLVLAVLTKQSFYLVPFAAVVYTLFNKNYKKAALIITSVISFIILFVFLAYRFQFLQSFITLTTGQTKLAELIDIGFLSYIQNIKAIAFIFLPPLAVTYLISKKSKQTFNYAYFFYNLIFWVLAISIRKYLKVDAFVGPVKHFPEAFFIISCLAVVFSKKLKMRGDYALCLLLLFVAWSSSISWGYQSVVLFLAPMIFVLSLPIYSDFDSRSSYLHFSIILLAFITFFIGYQNPYNLDRAQNKSEMNYDMSKLYPRLKFIKADKQTYKEHEELKSLIAKYGENFTVLPAATLVHYITDTQNPIGIDWVINAETNFQKISIIQTLESKNTVIFLKSGDIKAEGKYGSEVTKYIVDNWNKIESGKYYDVYCLKQI